VHTPIDFFKRAFAFWTPVCFAGIAVAHSFPKKFLLVNFGAFYSLVPKLVTACANYVLASLARYFDLEKLELTCVDSACAVYLRTVKLLALRDCD
jgi:hypothetical protein